MASSIRPSWSLAEARSAKIRTSFGEVEIRDRLRRAAQVHVCDPAVEVRKRVVGLQFEHAVEVPEGGLVLLAFSELRGPTPQRGDAVGVEAQGLCVAGLRAPGVTGEGRQLALAGVGQGGVGVEAQRVGEGLARGTHAVRRLPVVVEEPVPAEGERLGSLPRRGGLGLRGWGRPGGLDGRLRRAVLARREPHDRCSQRERDREKRPRQQERWPEQAGASVRRAQRAGDLLGAGGAAVGRRGKAAHAELAQPAGDRGAQAVGRADRGAEGVEVRVEGRGRHRRATGEAGVEHGSQAVDVGVDADLAALGPGLLGRPVAGGAEECAAGGQRPLRPLGVPGQAEVGQQGLRAAEEHVVGFEVPMQHTAAMDVGQGMRQLFADADRLPHRQRPLREARLEAQARDVVQGQPRDPRVLPCAEDRDHPRVAQARQRLDLDLEPAAHLRVGRAVGEQQLERHVLSRRSLSAVDDAHAAATDLSPDPVGPNLLHVGRVPPRSGVRENDPFGGRTPYPGRLQEVAMQTRSLAFALAVLVGCSGGPPSEQAPPRAQPSTSWSPLPAPAELLTQTLPGVPRYLGVDPGKVVVPAREKAPQRVAHPTLTAEVLERWRSEGHVVRFARAEDNAPLPGTFFGSLDTSDSSFHKQHRTRVEVDDDRAISLEFLVDSQRPVLDFEVQLRGLLLEPRLASGASIREQFQALGVDPERCALQAVHPELGAVYSPDVPGLLLVSAARSGWRVRAVFQGPLPGGFTPWDELAEAARERREAGRPLGPLTPWLRHAALGELEGALGGPAVAPEEYAALRQRLDRALEPEVSPGQLLSTVRYAQDLERGLALNADPQPPLLVGYLPRLRAHAVAQRERAGGQGLPTVAATWGWLAWELGLRTGERDFGLALRSAVLPVLAGQVKYSPEAVEGTPLGERSGVSFSSPSVKRDDSLLRWRVAFGDFDSIQGAPTEDVPTQVEWTEPNPAYFKWEAQCEDLQDQIDYNLMSRPTIEVPTGGVYRNGDPITEQVPDTSSTEHLRAEELQSQLDVLLLDEPPLELKKEKTVTVSVQRYTGSVTRRYSVFAPDERVIERFDEVTEVDLALRRHPAIPEAGVAALDEHMTLEQVSRAQERGVIQRDLGAFYHQLLQRALRGELERRVPQGVDPSDLADELAWGQWWMGLEVDDDLRPALGAALELQAGDTPLCARPVATQEPPAGSSWLSAVLARLGDVPNLPR